MEHVSRDGGLLCLRKNPDSQANFRERLSFLSSCHLFPPAWLSEAKATRPPSSFCLHEHGAPIPQLHSCPTLPGPLAQAGNLTVHCRKLPEGLINSSIESIHQQTVPNLEFFGSCASKVLALLFPPILNCYNRIFTHPNLVPPLETSRSALNQPSTPQQPHLPLSDTTRTVEVLLSLTAQTIGSALSYQQIALCW